ncbi:beta-lactamase-like protein [Desarmillaria tabescens]|uniref:Beta-lactamase-like protein n=1 Tax=Armillaria tabescens TaxID=1929756 RepID=A0AA39TNM0_ARMTA|nr:beta-lactamase-like protein [Desarmillaria tabescens]KAK0465222.1 beta-lactamase-like protein [Desarmillaria tabescens]
MSHPVELIFLGTGTSSSIPHVDCLTNPPDGRRCRTCLSTLLPEGKRNIRRNTSAVIRMAAPKDGRDVTIVIDAGKTFQAAAVEWFPKYGLRKIDALLITHPHADAMNGLDDLRGWTLGKRIQEHIDVYVSQNTFTEVQRCFPYLVSKEFASGGGDVPEFKWHIIDDKVPFEIEDTGIMVTPFSVHHGRVFSTPPCPSTMSTPATVPSTPTTSQMSQLTLKDSLDKLSNGTVSPSRRSLNGKDVIQPYYCFGFKVQEDIVYLSDTSYIPDDAMDIILSSPTDDSRSRAALPLFILDCLHLRPHTSHFGIVSAVDTARRVGALRTYLTGFSHEVSHEEWVRITEVVSSGRSLAQRPGQWLDEITNTEQQALGMTMKEGENAVTWMRPAFDGLRIWVDNDIDQKTVRDDTY